MRLTFSALPGPIRARPTRLRYPIEHRETQSGATPTGHVTESAGPGVGARRCFVSHRHPDHRLDVIASHVLAYGPIRAFGVPLYGPVRAGSDVGFADGGRIGRGVRRDSIEDGDRVTTDPHLVRRRDRPPVDTLALMGDRPPSLCYSADTGPAGDWMRLAKDVDLFSARRSGARSRRVSASPHRPRLVPSPVRRSQAADAHHIPPHLDRRGR